MRSHVNKKGIAFNLVTMIILVIVLVITVVLFVRVYAIVKDDGSRQLCSFEGLKGQVANVKAVSFWKTYELSCKAEKSFLKLSELNAQKMTPELVKSAQTIYGTSEGSGAQTGTKLQNYFANRLKSCWQITGNRDTFQWKEMNFALVDPAIVKEKAEYYYSKNLISQDAVYTAKASGGVISACVVCSTTYFDSSLQSFAYKADLTQILKDKSYNTERSIFDEINVGKTLLPLQQFHTQIPQSVVYVQWDVVSSSSDKITVSKNMHQTPEKTAVLVINNVDVTKLCDVIVNQV